MTEKLFKASASIVYTLFFCGVLGDFYGLIFMYNFECNIVSKIFTMTILGVGFVMFMVMLVTAIIKYEELKDILVAR